MKKSTKIKIAFVVFTLISITFISRFARYEFHKDSMELLEGVGEIKQLEFDAGFKSEVALALQLSKSSIVIQHFENPEDETIKARAWEEFETYMNSFLGKSIFWLSVLEKDFYSDMAFSYHVNPNNPDDYWYNLTIYETDVYNFNINYNSTLNKTMLWVNVPVRNNGGAVVGMVGTGIPIGDFTDIMFSTLDEDITMYFYNQQLEITGTRGNENLADKLLITSSLPELEGKELIYDELSFLNTVSGTYAVHPISLKGRNA